MYNLVYVSFVLYNTNYSVAIDDNKIKQVANPLNPINPFKSMFWKNLGKNTMLEP